MSTSSFSSYKSLKIVIYHSSVAFSSQLIVLMAFYFKSFISKKMFGFGKYDILFQINFRI